VKFWLVSASLGLLAVGVYIVRLLVSHGHSTGDFVTPTELIRINTEYHDLP
jgi:hypothetical protein